MLLKLSSRFLTLAVFLGSLSYSAFSMETKMPSVFQTKEQIRLSLWYNGVYEQPELSSAEAANLVEKLNEFPVELSHPLNNWNL